MPLSQLFLSVLQASSSESAAIYKMQLNVLCFCQINKLSSEFTDFSQMGLIVGLNSKLTKTVQCSCCSIGLFISGHINIIGVKVQRCEISSLRFHGVCLFFYSRSGSRLSDSVSAMCTSGEESSVEWSSAQLDTDEQPSLEEWLVRSKATQLKSQMPQTNEYVDRGATGHAVF